MQGGANFNRVRVIYKMENINNGKIYIGMTVNLAQRRAAHLSSLRNQKHVNSRLQKDFNTYGEDSFRFIPLERVKGWKNALRAESGYIDDLGTFERGYNMVDSKRNCPPPRTPNRVKEDISITIYEDQKNKLLDFFDGDMKKVEKWILRAMSEKAKKQNIEWSD